MDLSKLSTEDLMALRSGDLSKVSTQGLQALRGAASTSMDADPTAGMSTTQRTLAGVGKAFSDVGLGVGQLLGLRSDEDVAESRRLDRSLMGTTAGTVGNVLGNVALVAPTAAIPGASTIPGAALIGGGFGLAQPATSTAERVLNVGLGGAGGAAGQKLANTIGSVARNSTSQLTLGQQQAAAAGRGIGMRLTPGKAAGSPGLQRVEAALSSNPMTASGFDAIREVNQKALNKAAAKAIGESADELSSPVLQRAEQRIGQVFNSVADKTKVPLDPVTMGGRLRQILAESDGMLANNADLASNGLWKRLDDFVSNQGGATREQLRKLSSDLGKKARAEMTSPMGDRALGDALFQAQEAVEDAITGTLSKAQKAAYDEARNQYRNLMTLTARTTVVNPSSGNVNGRSLASVLQQKDKGGFTFGRQSNDMYNAARFVQAFPDIVGDSGTATRSLGATDYITSLPTRLLVAGYLSNPVAKAAQAVGGAAGTAARALDKDTIKLLSRYLGVGGGVSIANALQQ